MLEGIRGTTQINQELRDARLEAGGELPQALEFVAVQILTVQGVFEVILGLSQRSPGDLQKTGELLMRRTPKAFGDVGRNRTAGRTDLIAELEVSGDTWFGSEPENRASQLASELPDDKVAMVPSSHARR